MTFLIFLIIISFLLNLFLIYRGMVLLGEVEALNQQINIERLNTLSDLTEMLETMRAIDLKGAFESDDEVGAVFAELKNLIEKYTETLT